MTSQELKTQIGLLRARLGIKIKKKLPESKQKLAQIYSELQNKINVLSEASCGDMNDKLRRQEERANRNACETPGCPNLVPGPRHRFCKTCKEYRIKNRKKITPVLVRDFSVRICKFCKTTFIPTGPRQKFCCVDCRNGVGVTDADAVTTSTMEPKICNFGSCQNKTGKGEKRRLRYCCEEHAQLAKIETKRVSSGEIPIKKANLKKVFLKKKTIERLSNIPDSVEVPVEETPKLITASEARERLNEMCRNSTESVISEIVKNIENAIKGLEDTVVIPMNDYDYPIYVRNLVLTQMEQFGYEVTLDKDEMLIQF